MLAMPAGMKTGSCQNEFVKLKFKNKWLKMCLILKK